MITYSRDSEVELYVWLVLEVPTLVLDNLQFCSLLALLLILASTLWAERLRKSND